MPRPVAIVASALLAAVSAGLLYAHVEDGKIFDRMPPFTGPAWRAAEGGLAGAADFDSSNVALLSWLPISEWPGANNANVVEGYVSQSGREYALLGLSTGTAFVEVTDPANAQKVTHMPGPNSLWRDVRTFGTHAYAVSEGGGGIQIFGLSGIDSGTVSLVGQVDTPGSSSTHTVFVDKASGFLYRCGGSGNGLRIYSLANPAAPAFVAQWQDRYVHEVTVVTYDSGPYAGKQIAFACGGFNNGGTQSGLSILDVTDKSNIITLVHYQYPNAQYSHQMWPTPDLKYAYLDDEKDEQNLGIPGTTRILNIEDLSAPSQVATWTNGLPAIDHNCYTKGNLLFLCNYRSGLRVLDITNPIAPVEIGFFDTFPGSDSASFNGLWDCDPFLPSGTVLGSDIERGLFVWYIGAVPLSFTFPDGLPTLINPAGQVLGVAIEAASGLTIDPDSVKLVLQSDSGTTEIPAVEVKPGVYEALTPALACGEEVLYSFTATASNGITLAAPQPGAFAVAALDVVVGYSDSMETNNGWTTPAAGDDATTGQWVRVDPNGTSAQPEDDNSPGAGTFAWVTGQGFPGGSPGDADVDGGSTTLTSPIFDGLDGGDGSSMIVEYYRWYSNNLGGNPGQDSMPVWISNDAGTNWILLEAAADNLSTWTRKSFRIADYVVPTSQMRVKFVARDLSPGSLVEAGVDDFRVVQYICAAPIVGDLNGDGLVDGADLGILLSQWGGKGTADLNDDGVVDGADFGIMLANWG